MSTVNTIESPLPAAATPAGVIFTIVESETLGSMVTINIGGYSKRDCKRIMNRIISTVGCQRSFFSLEFNSNGDSFLVCFPEKNQSAEQLLVKLKEKEAEIQRIIRNPDAIMSR